MSLNETFVQKIQNDFSKKRVMVIGDLMVDEYVIGKVTRISPEAPVPVLNFVEKRLEAGGASNVARNLQALGAKVFVSGTAANDEHGDWLREHLKSFLIGVDGVFAEQGRPTTVKTRYATKSQQLIRVDSEDPRSIKKETQEKIIKFLSGAAAECDAVLFSDYKKGVFGDANFVREAIAVCKSGGAIVGIDSKSRDTEAFAGADFVKPNNLELEEAVGIKIQDADSLDKAGRTYLEKSGAKALVVTRGERGISIFIPGQARKDFASRALQVYDVTGAGDTVISAIALGLCSGLLLEEAVQLANLAASVVISKVGTATVSQEELLRRVKFEQDC